MTEHFENLWERSEVIAEKYYDDLEFKDNSISYNIYGIISELQENLICLKQAVKNEHEFEYNNILGKMLFNITFLSKKLNINTHAALKEHIEDIKIEMLDPDIDNTEE